MSYYLLYYSPTKYVVIYPFPNSHSFFVSQGTQFTIFAEVVDTADDKIVLLICLPHVYQVNAYLRHNLCRYWYGVQFIWCFLDCQILLHLTGVTSFTKLSNISGYIGPVVPARNLLGCFVHSYVPSCILSCHHVNFSRSCMILVQ